MEQGLAALLLGLILAGCLAVNEAFAEVSQAAESMQTKTVVSETEVTLPDSPFSFQYSIEELAEHYDPPKKLGDKTWIPVSVINQYPELPVGCEITSAAVLLNYLGFSVDKVWLQENFLEDSYKFRQVSEDIRIGPDPSKVFIGNPKESGFGCFAPVIRDSLEKYFRFAGSTDQPVLLEDANQKDLEKLLDLGVPVIVWASLDMKPFRYTANNEWILETTGEAFRWPGNAHVMVLCGYDKEKYYFSDCNDKESIVSYDKAVFLQRWEQFGKQGVLVKINDEN